MNKVIDALNRACVMCGPFHRQPVPLEQRLLLEMWSAEGTYRPVFTLLKHAVSSDKTLTTYTREKKRGEGGWCAEKIHQTRPWLRSETLKWLSVVIFSRRHICPCLNKSLLDGQEIMLSSQSSRSSSVISSLADADVGGVSAFSFTSFIFSSIIFDSTFTSETVD